MNWSNVKLILFREIRDQLRDRRTLFMIAVLPILLYPLLGMSFLQVAQFMEEKSSTVLVVGAGNLAGLPPLVDESRAGGGLFEGTGAARWGRPDGPPLLELHFLGEEPWADPSARSHPRTEARAAVEQGRYDVAVYFPADFADQLEAYLKAIRRHLALLQLEEESHDAAEAADQDAVPQIPEPEIIYSTASEKSQIAFLRVSAALEQWRQEIVKDKLVAVGLPRSATKPFEVKTADVAEGTARRGAAIWSKVLPVLLLIWAMTGAFYPAIDLCAGEKERGTLETLLCSPAERSEIVLGKLSTIMLFSMATAVWNLATMGVTGWLIFAQLPQFGPPPAMAVIWLPLALVPVSALFSALCLALAALARSTKEGQYYLMPLLLITTPLVILPMAPGVELNLGNSLIPVTGVVLLLRTTLEGNLSQVWPFVLPVAAVTLGCCLLAIRWAVEQFNSESVLFREGERLDVSLWLRHLLQDRRPTPTVAGAVFCGAVILLVRFFLGLTLAQPDDFRGLVVLTLVTQLVVIATPALLMTVMLTTSPRRTLLLERPAGSSVAAAAALALLIYPAVRFLQAGVTHLYPPNDANREMLQQIEGMILAAPWWQVLLVLAVVPAVCEELAFRGFILSGFRHLGHKWRAIFYSALLFGASHLILQQSIIAFLIGVLIGYLVVQSGSIWPGTVFHVIYNGLGLISARLAERITPELLQRWPIVNHLVRATEDGQIVFRWPMVAVAAVLAVAGALLATALLLWMRRWPYPKSSEEQQYEALVRVSHADA